MITTNKETEVAKTTLTTYFILPLLKLNKNSFGKNNFINSFVTLNGEVVVYIKEASEAGDYYSHGDCIADVETDEGTTMIIYSIPANWKKDFELFIQSKYSKMSSEAKKQITSHAKANELMYMTPTGNKVKDGNSIKTETETSIIYLGLYKSKELKEHLEKELDVKIADSAELLDKLDKDIIEL